MITYKVVRYAFDDNNELLDFIKSEVEKVKIDPSQKVEAVIWVDNLSDPIKNKFVFNYTVWLNMDSTLPIVASNILDAGKDTLVNISSIHKILDTQIKNMPKSY